MVFCSHMQNDSSPSNFFIFSSVIFWVFQSSSINAKRKFSGVPHLPHICVICFVNLSLVLSQNITCILVSQVISLSDKWWCYQQNLLFNFMVSYLYSFNPCISISEMAGTSATVTYNSMRVDTPGQLLI